MAEILNSRKDMKIVTPMMSQYLEVKNKYSDYVLMYRLGDFYECFFEDALIASKELELTLTARDCGDGKRAAMCGVPFHKADTYIGRLVEHGFKVAVCDQVEDPKSATGIVKREVTKVVTPGTITDNELLNESKNNYLCAICYGQNVTAIAFADISTGEFSAIELKDDDGYDVLNEITAYQPREVVINLPEEKCKATVDFIRSRYDSMIETAAKHLFEYEKAREAVKRVFYSQYDKITSPELIMAIGALILYTKETQMSEVQFFKEINIYSKGKYLELDMSTKRNLELVESMRSKEKRGSLLWVLDKTETAMGARLLRSWIQKPLINLAEIQKRQNAVAEFMKMRAVSDELGELLSAVLDIERLTAKAVYGKANAKDLATIYRSILPLSGIKSLIEVMKSDSMKSIVQSLDTLEDIAALLGDSIDDNPPVSIREGGMIKEGFDKDIDYYRSIKNNGNSIKESIEQREKEATGIRTLKVGYNRVFGYYIEVSKSFVSSVPDRYIRKQTLTNCERYITQELKDMESTILGAEEKIVELEYILFCKIRDAVSESAERIRKTAELVAEIDVYRSFAEVARKNSYVCPEMDLSTDIVIKDGRHPVVEKYVKDSYFVPNDTNLNTSTDRVLIITGPNMAGKSTYMRQVAIITLMAQIGSFVPAREARIGVVDKLFTRVGASDDLASGQSTFMLEMNEVAYILKNATSKSLIIYDEVGRGTSTFDGMAIAKAVVEYTNSKKVGAKTLFATHYHELTSMEQEMDGIVNYNIVAKKRGDNVTFLRKIVRGGTDDSFGIEVAKLAGVPNDVIKRAKDILAELEEGKIREIAPKSESGGSFDLFSSIISTKESEVAEKLRECDVNTMTPIEAMNLIFTLKKMLSN